LSTAPHPECPKCLYVRQAADTAPAWRCPRCGGVYKKFAADPAAKYSVGNKAGAPATVKTAGKRFKAIRVTALLIILIFVAANTWLTRLRVTSWDHPLRVVVYPIDGDGSAIAAQYIAKLKVAQFDDIEQTVKEQALHYGITVDEPMNIALAKPVNAIPPLPPRDGDMLKIIWWSLRLRLWASRMDHYDGPAPEVRAFTLYYDPRIHPLLEHSTGLEKGMIGVIKLFASDKMAARNNIVMLHELLHTLGATDKYDLRTDQPIYPDGYAEPELQPRLPQKKAEIMAGRIPLSPTRAEMPGSLADVVVGPATAREIGWIK
jgi:hypothetical protein